MKAMLPVIASNWVPSLQMRSVGSHSFPEERRKERTGWVCHSGHFLYRLQKAHEKYNVCVCSEHGSVFVSLLYILPLHMLVDSGINYFLW